MGPYAEACAHAEIRGVSQWGRPEKETRRQGLTHLCQYAEACCKVASTARHRTEGVTGKYAGVPLERDRLATSD